MKFLITIHGDHNWKSGAPPNPKLMEAVSKLGAEATKAGKMIFSGGLPFGIPGARIVVDGDKLSVTDGPFAETKELIAGFAIFELASREEAVQAATDFMKLHREILGPDYKGVAEVHQVFGS